MRKNGRQSAGPWPDGSSFWMTGVAAYAVAITILVVAGVPGVLAVGFALPVAALAMITVHARDRIIIAVGVAAVLAVMAVIITQHEALHAHPPSGTWTEHDHQNKESLQRDAAEAGQAAVQAGACGPAYGACYKGIRLMQGVIKAERYKHREEHRRNRVVNGSDQEQQRDRFTCRWETRTRRTPSYVEVRSSDGSTKRVVEYIVSQYKVRVCSTSDPVSTLASRGR